MEFLDNGEKVISLIQSFCNQIPVVKMSVILSCCIWNGIFKCHFLSFHVNLKKLQFVIEICGKEKHIAVQENQTPRRPYIYLKTLVKSDPMFVAVIIVITKKCSFKWHQTAAAVQLLYYNT